MKTFFYIFITFIGLLNFACNSTASQTGNISENSFPQVENANIKSEKIEENNLKVKWLYIETPTKFEDYDIVTGAKIVVFYQNGELGRMWTDLRRKDAGTLMLTAYFDEVVEFGKWQEEKGAVKIKIENCRCDHCDEDHGEKMTKKQLQNPIPLSETWKLENGKLGEPESILVGSKNKYRLVKESEFIFLNYNEMITEPLKIKGYNKDRKCLAYDLEGF